MSTLKFLRKELGEKKFKAMPARLKKLFKELDALPPAPKPLTAKRLEKLLG